MSPDLDAIRAALDGADRPHTDDCEELTRLWWCTCGHDRDVEHLSDRAPEWLAALLAAVDDVLKMTYASDDGTEYEHDHGVGDGYPECPACWAEGIRRACAVTE